ncbi:MAG: hypothetical protein II453_10935 [Alphaproteobacteria bacterium]|nr:hypothetical protein [Alphaproteobacteria bacterium]
MKDHIRATDSLPKEFTPVWVCICGRRQRKMYLVGRTFFYYNKELSKNGNYSSIGESVLCRYV